MDQSVDFLKFYLEYLSFVCFEQISKPKYRMKNRLNMVILLWAKLKSKLSQFSGIIHKILKKKYVFTASK